MNTMPDPQLNFGNLSNDIEVFSFCDDADNRWYGNNGLCVPCSKEVIDHLWWQWAMNVSAYKMEDINSKGITFLVLDDPMILDERFLKD